MRSTRLLASIAATALAATAAIAAAPAGSTSTVSVSGNTITVAGKLAANLETVVVGTDDLDSLLPAGGNDLVEMRVGFPSAGKFSLSLVLGDVNPATGHMPAAAQYAMTPTIGTDSLELVAGADQLSGGLKYGSQTCEASTGTNQCTSSPVDGKYAAGVITWTVSSNALPGADINAGTGKVYAQFGNPSAATLTLTGTAIDEMGINAIAYVPAANLLIDGVKAGSARLSNAGYSVSAGSLAAGAHTVQIELCGGLGECSIVDLGSVTIAG